MSRKNYDWKGGAELGSHSEKKHVVLEKYFREYLLTRCKKPLQETFRLVVVDGFSGGGRYKEGDLGSPILFIEALIKTSNEISIRRVSQGFRPVRIICHLIFNDISREATEQLKSFLAPYLLKAKNEARNLEISHECHCDPFEFLYPRLKERLNAIRTGNVIFNLDQCGYSHVPSKIIRDIMVSWRNAEIIFTFAIGSMLTFLSQDSKKSGASLESDMRERIDLIIDDKSLLSKKEWMGEAEKIVYFFLKECAPFVSPFSINNPDGWNYWLMHFANSYRARQVYNNILHEESDTQAHFGRAGLKMLSYDPSENGAQLYLFDSDSRKLASESLIDDIPDLVSRSGDTMLVEDFCATVYNDTPAHSEDINQSIINSPDMEVITGKGGVRKKPNSIKVTDTIKIKGQRSFIFT